MKKSEIPKRKFRVSFELDTDTLQEIDRLVIDAANDNVTRVSRASVCKDIIDAAINRNYENKEQQIQIHNRLLKLAVSLQERGNFFLKKNDHKTSASLFLMAAAKEIEALAILGDRDESLIKGTLIKAIQLLKKGTGYRSLPNVPVDSLSVDLLS